MTRSAARLAADSSPSTATPGSSTTSQPPTKSRKRKVGPEADQRPIDTSPSAKFRSSSSGRATKKQRLSSGVPTGPTAPKPPRRAIKQSASMAKPGYNAFHNQL